MKKKILLTALIAFAIVIAVFNVRIILTQMRPQWNPDYAMADILPLLSLPQLSADDYEKLFLQTGLSKPAIDDLREFPDFIERVLSFQADFFEPDIIIQRQIPPVTVVDMIGDNTGQRRPGFSIAPLREGDILLTFAQRSIGWQHGHCGLVVDAANGMVLEALQLGHDTTILDAWRWRYYPTFAILRLTDGRDDLARLAAEHGERNLPGVPYMLFTGIFPPNLPNEGESLIGTQCAHAVWYPYLAVGVDIDASGEWPVWGMDFLMSDELKVVQIYGIDPHWIIEIKDRESGWLG